MGRVGNNWAEMAKEILKREEGTPRRFVRRGGCECKCHEICHTCGRPFVGNRFHINCADMAEPSEVVYAFTD